MWKVKEKYITIIIFKKGGGTTPVFLTWMDFSALHLFKCGWRWSKPIADLQQFCKNLWSGSAITAAWGDVRLLFTEERLPISTEQKTAVASLLWLWVSKNGLFMCGMCVHATVHVQGHQNQKTALCARTSPHFGASVFTKKTNENGSKCNFHFCYSEGKSKKKNATQKLHPQLEVWKDFKGRTVHSSSFYRLPLQFYKHSLTKRIIEDVLQSTEYIDCSSQVLQEQPHFQSGWSCFLL